MLLAPAGAPVEAFANVTRDATAHEAMLHRVQRLRGEVYVDDGAAPEQLLDASGRHVAADDPLRWHIVLLDPEDAPIACVSLRLHMADARPEEVTVYELAHLADDDTFAPRLHRALGDVIDLARSEQVHFGEAGGMAVSTRVQHVGLGLVMSLAGWSLCRVVGHHIGVSGAGVRNGISSIHQRSGAWRLHDHEEALPQVLHPVFQDPIEVLGFDTRKPSDKCQPRLAALAEHLPECMVLADVVDNTASSAKEAERAPAS